jgi:hypothetical protein
MVLQKIKSIKKKSTTKSKPKKFTKSWRSFEVQVMEIEDVRRKNAYDAHGTRGRNVSRKRHENNEIVSKENGIER